MNGGGYCYVNNVKNMEFCFLFFLVRGWVS